MTIFGFFADACACIALGATMLAATANATTCNTLLLTPGIRMRLSS
jgi:hypothetical protein